MKSTRGDNVAKEKDCNGNCGYLCEAWGANVKRTYDEFIQESLESLRDQRQYLARIRGNHETSDNALRSASLVAVQNSVENNNALSKQHLAHRDIATNKTWNLEPSEGAAEAVVLRSVTIDDASLKAIGAAVAAAVVDGLKDNG